MSYLEELLPEFRKGAKIRRKNWGKEEFIRKEDSDKHFYDEDRNDYRFFGDDFESDDWELYQNPIDYDYIIKNKCLCWFWDDNPNYVMRLGYLTRLMASCPNNEGFIYCKDNGMAFKNCRPVRRDEVTFYEDIEDD